MGIQQAFGVGESVDLRLRLEGVFVDKEVADLQAGVLGFGPKFGFVKTQKFFFSGYFPFGFAFGKDIETAENIEFHPTLLFTYQPVKYVEINPSVKYLLGGGSQIATNLGLGLGPLDKWVIRAEYGFLWDPGESGHNNQFSVGFTFYY